MTGSMKGFAQKLEGLSIGLARRIPHLDPYLIGASSMNRLNIKICVSKSMWDYKPDTLNQGFIIIFSMKKTYTGQ